MHLQRVPAESTESRTAVATAAQSIPAAQRKTPGEFEIYTTAPPEDMAPAATERTTDTINRSLFPEPSTVPVAQSPMARTVRDWTSSVEAVSSYIEALEAENGETVLLASFFSPLRHICAENLRNSLGVSGPSVMEQSASLLHTEYRRQSQLCEELQNVTTEIRDRRRQLRM